MLSNAFLRLVGFPLIERVTRSRFWSYYRQSVRGERQRRDGAERHRDRLLSNLLTVALGSELHRQRLDEAGLAAVAPAPADAARLLAQLPPVGKEAFRSHFPTGVTTGASPDDWRYQSTSGTLDRMTVIVDLAKRDHSRSSQFRVLRTLLGADVGVPSVEVPPNACNAVCGLEDIGPPTFLGYLWRALRTRTLFTGTAQSDLRGRFERQVMLPRTTLPPIEPAPARQLAEILDGHLRTITREAPHLLRAYPVYLVWLADRFAAQGGTLPGLKLLAPFGGLASPQMVERCTRGFGVPFGNVYGTSELGSVAVACGRGEGMHLFEDLFIMEVLRRGQPVAPGEPGQLVVTDLVNRTMPLIRYRVGDVARWHTGPCPCGRTSARLEVLGRAAEVLASPNGAITPSAVADTFFVDPAVANFRLTETSPNCFEAAVVAGLDARTPDLETWKERFAALHGGVQRLRTRLVPFLRPESSGKYQFVHPCRERESPL